MIISTYYLTLHAYHVVGAYCSELSICKQICKSIFYVRLADLDEAHTVQVFLEGGCNVSPECIFGCRIVTSPIKM